MNLELIEKIEERFSEINPRELETEAQRRKFFVDFCVKYLYEFNVDTDSVSKVQINQPEISCGNEMVSLINTRCAVSSIIPNSNLSLFNLISPSLKVLGSKVDLALRFHDFSDEVLTRLYEMCAPYEDRKKRISELMSCKNELIDQIRNINVVMHNKQQFIQQATTEKSDSEKQTQEYLKEKIQLQVQLQESVARKTNALSKKIQFTAQLKGLNSKIESTRNELLNRSIDSEGQVCKLESDLKELATKRQEFSRKKEELDAMLADCNKLKQLAKERTNTSKLILEKLNKAKELESRINQVKDKTEGPSDDVDREITDQERENEKLDINMTKQISLLENSISRLNTHDVKRNKLAALKKELKDIRLLESKLDNFDVTVKKLQDNYQKHHLQLQNMKEERMREARERLGKNNVIYEITKALASINKFNI